MVDDESPITGHTTALRRIKYVPSHEVSKGDLASIPPTELEQQVHLPNPAMDELIDPESIPAVDPTEIGLPRPRRHRIRYRLAQLAMMTALAVAPKVRRWFFIIRATELPASPSWRRRCRAARGSPRPARITRRTTATIQERRGRRLRG